ncbi:MAG: pyridoxal phosphate-dependent aminotransferase [Polynucleobacter sp.]|nr:pyridoxal phosphate-dependent aminotransferase [Polynucleobacter sp.]
MAHLHPAAPLTPLFPSRLPAVGTTIFTVMSTLAAEYQAINLGQGFPDFQCDPALINAVNQAMVSGHNQYPPMPGVLELRKTIANKIDQLYGKSYDPATEITITAGATQAIFTVILSCVSPGDEVIVIEPAFDCYLPAITMAGGKAISVSLDVQRNSDGLVEAYAIPWNSLAKAITPKTRLLLINSPHNPTGMVWQRSDLDRLADLLSDTNVLVCSDEVYEHMVFDGQQQHSASSHPALAARSFVVSSFGKTFHVTGWKIGYVAAPAALSAEFRKVHQFNVFSVNAPMQVGIAHYLSDPAHYLGLSAFYQRKRDFFRAGLSETRFKLLPAPGSYFQCVDYSALGIPQSDLSEAEFCRWLTSEIGVAAIPVSAFYGSGTDSKVIRFCFAKEEKTLETALSRLRTV